MWSFWTWRASFSTSSLPKRVVVFECVCTSASYLSFISWTCSFTSAISMGYSRFHRKNISAVGSADTFHPLNAPLSLIFVFLWFVAPRSLQCTFRACRLFCWVQPPFHEGTPLFPPQSFAKASSFCREAPRQYVTCHGVWKSKKRITAMKNNVPMAKEKADTFNAIAVAAQGEWNRKQGLKFARPTRILEEHQGAEVGRYYLCRSRDVGCK